MKTRILIIEDNDQNLYMETFLLEKQGYEVVGARDGREGLEAAGRLKADPRLCHIPVVALTAYAMVGDRERALAAGCDGYISKPVDVRRLPDQLKEFLP